MGGSRVDQAEGLVPLRQVGADDEDVNTVILANLGGDGLGPLAARIIVDDDIPALCGEMTDHGGANAAGGSGDQAGRSGQGGVSASQGADGIDDAVHIRDGG